MTQPQIDRLRECKRKAIEIKTELYKLWQEVETNSKATTYSNQEITDIQIINSIGTSAADLVIAFQRHDKIIN